MPRVVRQRTGATPVPVTCTDDDTGEDAIPTRVAHPLNPAVRKDANGIWSGDDLPVMAWEAPEARVVVSPELRERLQLASPVLRWSAEKYQTVVAIHRRDVHVIAELTSYLEGWSFIGRETARPTLWRVLLQDESGRWYAVTLGELQGSENVITAFGSTKPNFLQNRVRGISDIIERGG